MWRLPFATGLEESDILDPSAGRYSKEECNNQLRINLIGLKRPCTSRRYELGERAQGLWRPKPLEDLFGKSKKSRKNHNKQEKPPEQGTSMKKETSLLNVVMEGPANHKELSPKEAFSVSSSSGVKRKSPSVVNGHQLFPSQRQRRRRWKSVSVTSGANNGRFDLSTLQVFTATNMSSLKPDKSSALDIRNDKIHIQIV